MIKFLIGVLFGFVFAFGYYDGFVALEYKQKIKIASDSLNSAAEIISQKDQQMIELANKFQEIIDEQEKRYKKNFYGL